MTAFKSDFLNVLSSRGFIHQISDPASLDALPYLLIPHASVLLAGASGGFRTAEVLALGAAHVHVLEP